MGYKGGEEFKNMLRFGVWLIRRLEFWKLGEGRRWRCGWGVEFGCDEFEMLVGYVGGDV